ncbi:MAG: hypothetical protein J6T48_06005 [Bacteroidales bacterium]|nr:hypothetical protein [Bacteroidales bacterium]
MDKKTKLFIIAQVVIIALFAFLAIGCFGSSYTTDSYYDSYESKDYMHDVREEEERARKEEEARERKEKERRDEQKRLENYSKGKGYQNYW